MTRMNIEPCPFCKNENMSFWDYSVLNGLDGGFSVFCPLCKARGPKEQSIELAVVSWNSGVA